MFRVTRIRPAVGRNQRTSCSLSAHFRLPCPPYPLYPPLVSFPSFPLPLSPLTLASLSRIPCSHCLALLPPLPSLESSTVRAVAGAGAGVDVHNPHLCPVRSAAILLRLPLPLPTPDHLPFLRSMIPLGCPTFPHLSNVRYHPPSSILSVPTRSPHFQQISHDTL